MKKILPTPEAKEPYKMLYMELGGAEASARTGVPRGTMRKWASRYGWCCERAVPLKRGRPGATVSHYVTASVADAANGGAGAALTPSEALENSHRELATQTRTALAQATAAAAETAAAQQPVPVLSTAHLRDLAQTAASVFGWDRQQRGADIHNTLVISHEQWAQIREAARASEEESQTLLPDGEKTRERSNEQ